MGKSISCCKEDKPAPKEEAIVDFEQEPKDLSPIEVIVVDTPVATEFRCKYISRISVNRQSTPTFINEDRPIFEKTEVEEDAMHLSPNPMPKKSNYLHSKATMPIRVTNFIQIKNGNIGDSYENFEEIAEGAFGIVSKGTNKVTG
jgi:hypothetical protein